MMAWPEGGGGIGPGSKGGRKILRRDKKTTSIAHCQLHIFERKSSIPIINISEYCILGCKHCQLVRKGKVEVETLPMAL